LDKKICNKCKKEKEIAKFSKDKRNKNGINTVCKECLKQVVIKYRLKNPDRWKTMEKGQKLRYYEKHKVRLKNYRKEYYRKNKLAINNYCKSYRKSNMDKDRKWHKEYRKLHPEMEKAKKYKRRLKGLDGYNLTSKKIKLLQEYNLQTYKQDTFVCEYCRKNIYESYDLDHIIPLSKNGTNDLNNLAISCKECNRGENGKHSKLLSDYRPDLIDYFKFRDIKPKQR
jgi:hypothetical protein